MDQDLVPYFERLSQQIDGLREEMNQRFEQVDQRFEQVDQRFEQVDQRFEQVDQRFEKIDQRFEKVDQRFEAAETTARQTLVLVEGLRHEIQLVAEGVVGHNLLLARHRNEVSTELAEIKKLVELPYKSLDVRVRALEEWQESQHQDVLEIIRQRILGKPPRQQEPV